MAHAQKPDFVFRWNGRVHLNLLERQFSRLLAAEVCAPAVVMLDTPRSEVCESTGYPLHSPVSPSLPVPCVTVCHQVSNALYHQLFDIQKFCVLPKFICVFCMDLRTNSDYFCIKYSLRGFYNRGRERLLRGTNWVLKSNRHNFALKGLMHLIANKCAFNNYNDTTGVLISP